MYFNATLDASIAVVNAWEGDLTARTGNGDSPCLPYKANIKSDCSGFVGRPVEGPPL